MFWDIWRMANHDMIKDAVIKTSSMVSILLWTEYQKNRFKVMDAFLAIYIANFLKAPRPHGVKIFGGQIGALQGIAVLFAYRLKGRADRVKMFFALKRVPAYRHFPPRRGIRFVSLAVGRLAVAKPFGQTERYGRPGKGKKRRITNRRGRSYRQKQQKQFFFHALSLTPAFAFHVTGLFFIGERKAAPLYMPLYLTQTVKERKN
jgi:hypothetical protein